ncbi:MAG: hypothetical protein HZB82_06830 [Deltaproteobacteria bacterium]|nr:hypothetical protein [Deltaproteobacteria bacterium]
MLLIPSGGLFGMENSAFFKASLDEKPAQLPEATQGGTASVSIIAVNQTTLDATQVKLTLLDLDRKVVSEQTVAMGMNFLFKSYLTYFQKICSVGLCENM